MELQGNSEQKCCLLFMVSLCSRDHSAYVWDDPEESSADTFCMYSLYYVQEERRGVEQRGQETGCSYIYIHIYVYWYIYGAADEIGSQLCDLRHTEILDFRIHFLIWTKNLSNNAVLICKPILHTGFCGTLCLCACRSKNTSQNLVLVKTSLKVWPLRVILWN